MTSVAIMVLAYEMCVANAIGLYDGMAYATGRLTYTQRAIAFCDKKYGKYSEGGSNGQEKRIR